jgi:hypothetical protein
MMNNTLMREPITKDMTYAIRGISALGVYIFHISLSFVPSPLTNFWGGVFVAVFLILGGYGINESYKINGLKDYWKKRWRKVVLPTIAFACLFNFIASEGSLKAFLSELLYSKPTYWFVFYIVKCYAVFWLSMRFFKHRGIWLMFGFAILCLNYNSGATHLESEQAFSFLLGVLVSRYKDRFLSLSNKKYARICVILFCVGAALLLMKLIPCVYAFKGTIWYNYLQCPFRLAWGTALLMMLLKCCVLRNITPLKWIGKYSMELYVSHVPFLVFLTGDIHSLSLFLLATVGSFLVLVVLNKYVLYRLTTPLLAYIMINSLFVAKYSERVLPENFEVLVVAVIIFHYLLLTYGVPRIKSAKTFTPIIVMGVLGICAMLCLQYMIDPNGVQVDRWSALHNPIANLLSGKYPYLAPTHLDGYASPFPMWQLFHVLFFLLGNVGLSLFFVLALFFYSIYTFQGKPALSVALLLMIFSPAVWYEAAVRSDLITNMLLVATLVNVVFQRISVQWLQRNVVLVATLIGLLACTRVVILLPIAVLLFPYYVKFSLRQQINFVLFFLVVFIMTFIPFALWDLTNFFYFEHNPWSLQTRQGNGTDFLLFIPLGIFLALQWRSDCICYYRNTIVLLFVFIATTFIHNMIQSGNYDLFSSAYDITYFTTALPFCILSMVSCQSRSGQNESTPLG